MNSDLYAIALVTIPLIYSIGIACALVAISQERSSQGAVAWAVALVLMPFVSVPLFIVFGGWRFRGYVKKFRVQLANMPIDGKWLPDTSPLNSSEMGAMQVVEKLARFPFTRGNKVDLLIDAAQTYDALFSAIDTARERIWIQFYIINDDQAGTEFARHLEGAAARGVCVLLLYDEIGCASTPARYFNRLMEAGISVSPFGSATKLGKHFQINFRNHRKIAIFDDQTAYTGGLNIGDEYLGKSRTTGNWRDTHVRFTGPAVKSAQFSFLEDWYWATGKQLAADGPIHAMRGHDQIALLFATGPADKEETFKLFIVQAINAAQVSIWIATPYFVPDNDIMTALQLAVMRGIEVRLLVPEKSDNWLVGLANPAWLDVALEIGASVNQYHPGFMHQKVMLIDGRFSSIGSGNMDNRSFSLNFEATLLVSGRQFGKMVQAMLKLDFENSQPLAKGFLAKRSLIFRLMVRLARLASPLL